MTSVNNTRRPPQTAAPGPRGGRKYSQKDMDSACHRLSRVPQKFSTSKAVQAEKSEPFAVAYFKNNPEAASDIRPPDEKLQEIDSALQAEDLEPSEKFSLLVQQKALRFIACGETSPEALRSCLAIGAFYNEQHRPDSAIRHLEKAKALESQCEISEEESAQIAVELADAHMTYKTNKHTREAAEALNPHSDTEIEDPVLRYRRDLLKARIFNAQGRHEEALEPYKQGIEGYSSNRETDTEEYAELLLEAGDSADIAKDVEAANDYFRRSADVYENYLDNKKLAEQIRSKIKDASKNDDEGQEKEIDEGDNHKDNSSDNDSSDKGSDINSDFVSNAEEEDGRKKSSLSGMIRDNTKDLLDEE